ncbi:MAG: hypothetical protein AAGU18_08795 [Proteiniphilum sp.]
MEILTCNDSNFTALTESELLEFNGGSIFMLILGAVAGFLLIKGAIEANRLAEQMS